MASTTPSRAGSTRGSRPPTTRSAASARRSRAPRNDRWPDAWRVPAADAPLPVRRRLEQIFREKAAKARREGPRPEPDHMDAFVQTSPVGSSLETAWRERRDAHAAENLERWAAADGRGSGLFASPPPGTRLYGLADAVSRRHADQVRAAERRRDVDDALKFTLEGLGGFDFAGFDDGGFDDDVLDDAETSSVATSSRATSSSRAPRAAAATPRVRLSAPLASAGRAVTTEPRDKSVNPSRRHEVWFPRRSPVKRRGARDFFSGKKDFDELERDLATQHVALYAQTGVVKGAAAPRRRVSIAPPPPQVSPVKRRRDVTVVFDAAADLTRRRQVDYDF